MTRLQLVVLAAVLLSVESYSHGRRCQSRYGYGLCLTIPECMDHRHPPSSSIAAPLQRCPRPFICCPDHRQSRQIFLPRAEQPSSYAELVASTPVLSQRKKYMALIGYSDRKNIDNNCQGVVVSENLVLAAAHCAQHHKLGEAKWAVVGDVAFAITKDLKTLERKIVEVIFHPGNNGSQYENDIAVFRLDLPVDLEHLVRAVCLHRGPALPDKATLIGWGGEGDVLSTLARGNHLIQETVDLFNDTFCHELFDKSLPTGIDTKSMFCAGNLGEISDDCIDNASGPLVVEGEADCPYTLVGLHSFGGCGRFDVPAVFTRVSYYTSWLEEIISKHAPGATTPSLATTNH